MRLELNHIHIWPTVLSTTPAQEKALFALLSADEQERVHRIRLSAPKQRMIASRGILRQILSYYLDSAPHHIEFNYSEHHKPYLAKPEHAHVQFNVTHSHDKALYAFTLTHDVGVDIEKIEANYLEAVAKRYFSIDENRMLTSLPPEARAHAFYRLWSRKEALVKAIGHGLSRPLSAYDVSLNKESETLTIENKQWTLTSLSLYDNYAAALATAQPIQQISYWRLSSDGYTMITS